MKVLYIFDNLAIVVASCDKYKSVWTPYFKLLEKYFAEAPKNIYLLVENMDIPQEVSSKWCEKLGGVNIINSTEKEWSKRIKDSLRRIDKKYILFLLEDFFLQDFVKTDDLKKAVEWMDENEAISAIRIYPFWESHTNTWPKYRDNFFVIDRNYEERVNAQATIWRKDRFEEILIDNETAWQFEILASNRSRQDPYLYLGYFEPLELKGIFPYQIAQANGYGITAGKWLWNNEQLFQENGIDCDFSKLGIMSEKEWTFHYKSRLYKTWRRVIKLINIVKVHWKNKQKIDVKHILDNSLLRTKFKLLDDIEYQTLSDRDLKLIDRSRD